MRDTQYGNWQRHAAILPSAYVSMIDEAGGIPLIIPPAGDMTNLLKSIDGLIISGGPDVSPTLYGQTPGPMTKEFYPDQDETEIGLISSALEMDMPLLGVCRGMQILSIAHGGSLHSLEAKMVFRMVSQLGPAPPWEHFGRGDTKAL